MTTQEHVKILEAIKSGVLCNMPLASSDGGQWVAGWRECAEMLEYVIDQAIREANNG